MTVKGGFLIIISGPSGAGKSSITSELLNSVKNLDFSVSYTTRDKRTMEKDKEHYKFISRDQFEEMVDDNLFLEYEQVHGNLYGTPIEPIRESLRFKHSVLLDIDVKGASSIINTNHFDCLSIFIKPPSINELKKRLVDRNDMSTEEIDKRIEVATKEILQSKYFNHMVINEDFEECLNEVKRIIGNL
ncbi:MAG: guanylate kinase [Thermodesulfobacteriota bacterium]|nr:guanylate kinase [Thermodesulfobacteriota bacterium]